MVKRKPLLPLDVTRTIASLCHDYDRRRIELERELYPNAVLTQYRFLNDAIDRALEEVCEYGIRDEMRRDIGLNRGHRMSQLYFMSEKTYKTRKRQAKLKIAEYLRLI